MAAKIKLLRSTIPGHVPASLESGQIAINEADGLLFWRDADGVVQSIDLGLADYLRKDQGGEIAGALSVLGDVVVSGETNETYGRRLSFVRDGAPRFEFLIYGAETGDDVGSNMIVMAYADDGAYLGPVMVFDRASRSVNFGTNATIAYHQIWHAGNDGEGSGLDADTVRGATLGNSATRNVGTEPGTVAAGDDPRIVGAAQASALGNSASRNVGTTAGTVAAGNDSRFVSGAVTSARMVHAGDRSAASDNGVLNEPWAGSVITGGLADEASGLYFYKTHRHRYLQVYASGAWVTVGYA